MRATQKSSLPLILSGLFSFTLGLTVSAVAVAAEGVRVETPAFSDVRAVIDQAVAKHAADRVLVVFDIDNTILATDHDLGSEHWFLWQAELIRSGRLDEGAVASSVDDLLTVQSWIYTLTGTRAVEPQISADVRQLSARGVRFMALTSRNLDVHDATLRELARNGLDLTTAAPGPLGGFGGSYLPYDPENPAAYGLTAEDVARFGLGQPKLVTYDHGVMLTQGQHKGSMLRTLLAKTGASFDAIVFVDDRPHHLEGVQAAFADRSELVHTVRYIHELPRVKTFHSSDKAGAKAQWCHLGGALRAAFGPGVYRTCADLP